MLSGTSLSLISFVRRLISTTSMAPKRTQVVHVNKGNDKIVIAQSTHDAATGLTTRSKEKSTSSLLTKQTSESACLLKLIRKHDEHQPLITLVSLGVKSSSPRARENSLQHYRILGINLLALLPDANSSIGSRSGSPTGMSKEENYSNRSNSFNSPFSMTMPVMVTSTTP